VAIRIGSNPLSLGLQSSLNKTDTTLSKTSERLSSGLRINRGSDDAAGLSISQSLNLNAKVYSQGVKNLNDGLSAINIADGAIDGLNTILSRIEEIAMQSANGTFSDTQRAVMQQEVTALQAEWNRIVDTTTFNGQQLLTGSTTRMVLQGGTQNTGTLAVQVGKEALAGGFDNYAGGTTRVNTTSAGGQTSYGSSSTGPVISADGRYVAFTSSASNLVAGDTNVESDAFIRDTLTGVTTRVSTSSAGVEGNAVSNVSAISADGRYVAFSSQATNLVAGDTNGQQDAFIKDTLTGVTTRVSTSSAGGQGNNDSNVSAISADGDRTSVV
jgi:flagellin-like hook-associated protein FlgL